MAFDMAFSESEGSVKTWISHHSNRIYSWVINYLSEFHWFHVIRFHNATLISKNLGRSDLLYFLNIQKRKNKTKKQKNKKGKN